MGLSAKVKIINGAKSNPGHSISVAVGGSVMSSFFQKEPYYTGYHVLILRPKIKLTNNEMLYYCMCLRANKYKYSYGRQANKTLKDVKIPAISDIPGWVNEVKERRPNKNSFLNEKIELKKDNWMSFNYTDIFEKIEKCKYNNAGSLLKNGNDISYIGAKKMKMTLCERLKQIKVLYRKGMQLCLLEMVKAQLAMLPIKIGILSALQL
ncbi:hypothetical protein [uncultured Gammaproteobacteria bacterium]|nr:hypothetical protein [uncultured Gammaproteobacteria bacterium]